MSKAAKQGLAQEAKEAYARRALAYREQVKEGVKEGLRSSNTNGSGRNDDASTLPSSGDLDEPIISFDDEFVPSATGPWDDKRFSLATPLVGLEPDTAHFDVLPRISLPKHVSVQSLAGCTYNQHQYQWPTTHYITNILTH